MKVGRTNLLSNLSEFRLALLLIVVGSGAALISLVSYYVATINVVVDPMTDEQLQAPALATLTAFLLGLVSIVYGAHVLFHQEWKRHESGRVEMRSKFAILARALCSRPYNILFAASALLYGALFCLVSGTLVYQPNVDLLDGSSSSLSTLLVACCDPIGQTPRLVIYVTSHLGLLLIPLNILLLVSTSWMVGANVSLAGFAYKTKAVGGSLKWLGSFGATTGLLTACPTCANLLLLGTAGGGDALGALLSSSQPVLVGGTIVLLSTNLGLMTAKLRDVGKCAVPSMNSPT